MSLHTFAVLQLFGMLGTVLLIARSRQAPCDAGDVGAMAFMVIVWPIAFAAALLGYADAIRILIRSRGRYFVGIDPAGQDGGMVCVAKRRRDGSIEIIDVFEANDL